MAQRPGRFVLHHSSPARSWDRIPCVLSPTPTCVRSSPGRPGHSGSTLTVGFVRRRMGVVPTGPDSKTVNDKKSDSRTLRGSGFAECSPTENPLSSGSGVGPVGPLTLAVQTPLETVATRNPFCGSFSVPLSLRRRTPDRYSRTTPGPQMSFRPDPVVLRSLVFLIHRWIRSTSVVSGVRPALAGVGPGGLSSVLRHPSLTKITRRPRRPATPQWLCSSVGPTTAARAGG